MSKNTLTPFLDEAAIATLVKRLGHEISNHYAGKVSQNSELLVLPTLKGAFLFGADLVRHITLPVQIDFIRVASYGSGTASSGAVRFLKDTEIDPAGRHVLVVDEIVDSGKTLDVVLKRIRDSAPLSLRVCSLLSKPSRREIEVQVDFLGQEVEDKFLVGYGLDYNERYRNSGSIHILS